MPVCCRGRLRSKRTHRTLCDDYFPDEDVVALQTGHELPCSSRRLCVRTLEMEGPLSRP